MARVAPDVYDRALTLRGTYLEPCCEELDMVNTIHKAIYVDYTKGKKRAELRIKLCNLHTFLFYCPFCGAKLETIPLSRGEYKRENPDEGEVAA